MDKRLNPESDIEIRERKISGVRSTNYAMRRSRAQMEQCMTPAMIDAEREIALGWTIRAGHMGYGSNDLTRVRGKSERDLDKEHRAVSRLVQWMEKCPKAYREAVLAISVFATPLPEFCEREGMCRQTAVNRFSKGLLEYCKLHGMSTEPRRKRLRPYPKA